MSLKNNNCHRKRTTVSNKCLRKITSVTEKKQLSLIRYVESVFLFAFGKGAFWTTKKLTLTHYDQTLIILIKT